MLDTRLVTTREGHKLRVARVGDGSPPLVLLHGYPETLQIFCRLANFLAYHVEVIAFDWPGMGQANPGPAGGLAGPHGKAIDSSPR